MISSNLNRSNQSKEHHNLLGTGDQPLLKENERSKDYSIVKRSEKIPKRSTNSETVREIPELTKEENRWRSFTRDGASVY